jgi:hypothetical protein
VTNSIHTHCDEPQQTPRGSQDRASKQFVRTRPRAARDHDVPIIMPSCVAAISLASQVADTTVDAASSPVNTCPPTGIGGVSDNTTTHPTPIDAHVNTDDTCTHTRTQAKPSPNASLARSWTGSGCTRWTAPAAGRHHRVPAQRTRLSSPALHQEAPAGVDGGRGTLEYSLQ